MTATLATWIGDVFIVAGAWGIGNRRRGAFAFTIVGEVVWIAEALRRRDWALAAVCTVFILLAVRSAVLWGRPARSSGVR